MKNPASRVLVIGLDGGTFDVINPLVEEGKLPNISKLMRDGVYGSLSSTIPPLTLPAWASFMTGKNPGKLGIFALIKTDKNYNIHPVTSTDIKEETMQDILSKYRMRSIIVNLPATYPPKEVNGIVISGLGTPKNAEFIAPRELRGEISYYEIGEECLDLLREQKLEKFLEKIYDITEKQVRALKYLLRNKEWDLFMYVFSGTDWIQHYLWRFADPSSPLFKEQTRYRDSIRDFYIKVDGYIGEILDAAGDVNVIIMSDHGFGVLKKRFNINDWLIKKGYLKLTDTDGLNLRFLAKIGINRRRIATLLEKLHLKQIIKRYTSSRFRAHIPYAEQTLMIEDAIKGGLIDWNHTKAYSIGGYGRIRLNLIGRESQGIVAREEYEKVRNGIIKDLRDLEVSAIEVLKPEEIYSGQFVEDSPDLLLLLENFECDMETSIGHPDIFSDLVPTKRSGEHRLAGIFIAKGPQIKKNITLNASILDLAPTILYLLGIPIPSDMDGKVLKEVIQDSFLKGETNRYVKKIETPKTADRESRKVLSKEDEKEIKKRLRTLGYL
jgi:predicted AlkP superfamily phosphohydrolase/phosphomutase